MIGAFWNNRALNKTGRIKCVVDFIRMNRLDFVGLQETKKSEFSSNVLNLINKDMD
jgi:hypothetical protein